MALCLSRKAVPTMPMRGHHTGVLWGKGSDPGLGSGLGLVGMLQGFMLFLVVTGRAAPVWGLGAGLPPGQLLCQAQWADSPGMQAAGSEEDLVPCGSSSEQSPDPGLGPRCCPQTPWSQEARDGQGRDLWKGEQKWD